jgi:hypothetical protein
MAAKNPKVARLRYGWPILTVSRDHIDFRRIRADRSTVACFVEDDFDLTQRESGGLNLKLRINEPLQLNGEHLVVPTRVQGELVICKNIRAALGLAQVRQAKYRHGVDTEGLSGGDASVPRDNLPVLCDQNRVSNPKRWIEFAI